MSTSKKQPTSAPVATVPVAASVVEAALARLGDTVETRVARAKSTITLVWKSLEQAAHHGDAFAGAARDALWAARTDLDLVLEHAEPSTLKQPVPDADLQDFLADLAGGAR